MKKIFGISKFGKSQTLRMTEENDNKKSLFRKWLPAIMLCVGGSLMIIGVLIELGVLC